MKKIFLIIVAFIALVVSVAAQDVPRVISYQGVLVGADGKPESGNFDVVFGLQPLNGAQFVSWSEQRNQVSVRGGLFHVFLGDSSTPKGFPILHGDYALTIKVGNNTPYPVQLGSVPYALHALVADSLLKVIDSVRSSFKAEIAKFADSARASSISDTTKMKIPSGVPVGSIIAYWGNTPPEGWLLCDSSIIPSQYQSLIDFLGSSRTPDLRGMFLRGSNTTINSSSKGNDGDPDEGSRSSGIGVSRIGSRQGDAFQSHYHTISVKRTGGIQMNYVAAPGTYDDAGTAGTNMSGTSSETRPKNVYVNYIIKAR